MDIENRAGCANKRPYHSLATDFSKITRCVAKNGRIPEDVQNSARSDIGKASAVLYDGTGDVRKARHVRDEPHHRVKVISVHRQAPWSWKELMTAVDQIGAIGMSQASCESVPVSNHTVEQ